MRTVRFSRLKNLVILALIVLAVLQTGQLWLGNDSGHNFFYSLFEYSNSTAKKTSMEKAVIDPQTIVVGYGSNVFHQSFGGLLQSSIQQVTDAFVQEMVTDAPWQTAEGVQLDDLLNQKCVVYEFSFDVSLPQYLEAITEETGTLPKQEYITDLVAVPSGGPMQKSQLYLIDSTSGQAILVEKNQSSLSQSLWDAIDEERQTHLDGLRFVSSAQSGLNIFQHNVFVPQWSQSAYAYPRLKSTPVAQGETMEEAVAAAAAGFFATYDTPVMTVDENGMYVLNGEEAIVRYDPDGVLEYYGYGEGQGEGQTLSTAYHACKSFMKKDGTLSQNVYLSDVQLKSDGLLFCFDYFWEEMPILLSESLCQEKNITHAVEVMVEQNRVTRYRRYAVSFAEGEEDQVEVDFVYAMNETISAATQTITAMDDIYLGYVEDGSGDLGLTWFVVADGQVQQVSTKRESTTAEAAVETESR